MSHQTTFLFITFFAAALVSISHSAKRLRLRGIRCENSGKYVVHDFCFIKTYKKRSFYSIGFNLTRKINDIKFNVNFERKGQSEKFESVLRLENLEFCKMIEGSINPLYATVNQAIDYLKQFGNLVDVCTQSSGVIRFANVTWDNFFFIQALPNGEYHHHYTWFNDDDDKIMYIRLFANIL